MIYHNVRWKKVPDILLSSSMNIDQIYMIQKILYLHDTKKDTVTILSVLILWAFLQGC